MTDTALHEEEYEGRLDLRLWGRVLHYGRRHLRYIIGMAVMAGVTASFDMSFTLVTRKVINEVEARGPAVNLWAYGGLYVAMVFGFATGILTFIWLGAKISTGVGYDIRKAGFERLQELSFSFYDRRPVGWLVARMTSDCDRLARLLAWGVLDLTWGALLLVGVSVIMLVLNWRLGLLVLAIVPPMAWVSLVFQKRILRTSREVRKANSNITAAFNEAINGVRTTKTLVREAENLREFQSLTDRMFGSSVRNALWSAVFFPAVFTIGSLGVSLALWRGGQGVLAGRIRIGDLYAFLSFAGFFFMPIQELSRVFVDLQSAQAAAERIIGLLDTEPEIQDSPEVLAAVARHRQVHPAGAAGLADDGLPDRIETVEFHDVTFAYKQGPPVLERFSLRVERGQTIALVGPTGGGKTTIVGLLCRFYEPTAGEVRINGVEYRRRPLAWLQSNLGIVLQTPHLFSGSARQNIRYGRLDASDEDVERAARLAGAHEFIAALDGGYDAEVGKAGGRLSTGQKQLVALARAILADPQIFIMDEATSSVDTETERLIQAGIERVLPGRLSFVIAHRLSTIRSADRILLIDGGRIVEDGTHRGLIGLGGRYYELYTNQFAEERTEQVLHAPSATSLEAAP
ncbi:MAG TPA: ABC transporter ATP-binding protein [Phycisphaerae bacterium]|nr:ABC transporter ATP-binding protein [Phycisphaerae bacterium]